MVDCVHTCVCLEVEGVRRVAVGRCPALWKAGVRRVLFLESALNCLLVKAPTDYLMHFLFSSLRSEDSRATAGLSVIILKL